MNLLEQLLCSRVRAGIFRVLFGLRTVDVHLREIQRQTGFAIGTVRQDIQKLAEMGLVTARRDGNRLYYTATIRHPLYEPIHQIVLKTAGLVDILASALEGADIELAFVFGSVAGGTEGADSDVDLMVIGNTGLRTVSTMLSGGANKLGREINTHVMTRAEFVKRVGQREHFIQSVMASPKLFVCGTSDELEAMA